MRVLVLPIPTGYGSLVRLRSWGTAAFSTFELIILFVSPIACLCKSIIQSGREVKRAELCPMLRGDILSLASAVTGAFAARSDYKSSRAHTCAPRGYPIPGFGGHRCIRSLLGLQILASTYLCSEGISYPWLRRSPVHSQPARITNPREHIPVLRGDILSPISARQTSWAPVPLHSSPVPFTYRSKNSTERRAAVPKWAEIL